QKAKVPVLWRPLHEAEGKWFWWGAKGPEACVWLWRLLFDRLVHHHGINNLIWIWTSTGSPDAMNWYPGDEYVDVIGADIYLAAGSYGSSFITFDNIAAIYDGKKIIALSENGPIPDPEKLFDEGVAWSWFSTWSGHFITDGVINTASHIDKVYNDEYVITLDEIDAIDAIIASLIEKRENELPPVTGVVETTSLNFQNPLVGRKLVLEDAPYPARISIYDLHGKKQFSEVETTPYGFVEFDFQEKPAGIYLLKIFRSRTVEVYRVVKTGD
ncbi:MAG TPA: glycosyl hydrolase, partial [Chryseosolibacter sp.]|nr:glycosyl hydrolase [Chryseosolibacter sp.]